MDQNFKYNNANKLTAKKGYYNPDRIILCYVLRTKNKRDCIFFINTRQMIPIEPQVFTGFSVCIRRKFCISIFLVIWDIGGRISSIFAVRLLQIFKTDYPFVP